MVLEQIEVISKSNISLDKLIKIHDFNNHKIEFFINSYSNICMVLYLNNLYLDDCDPCPICNKEFIITHPLPNYTSVFEIKCNTCLVEIKYSGALHFINYNVVYSLYNNCFAGEEKHIDFLNNNSPEELKEKLLFAVSYFKNLIFE